MAMARAEEKNMDPKMLAALGLKPNASAEDFAAVAAALEVGRAALALTGTDDAGAALKALGEWQAKASKAAELEAAHAAKAAEEEAAERVSLVRSMVKAGALTPAKAWKASDAGFNPENGISAPWASMKMKDLRLAASAFEAPPARRASAEDESKRDPAVVTADDVARAKDFGVKPESLAAARADMANAINHRAGSPAVGS
jgi:hypothetical protein